MKKTFKKALTAALSIFLVSIMLSPWKSEIFSNDPESKNPEYLAYNLLSDEPEGENQQN